jgi:hypothetical protein
LENAIQLKDFEILEKVKSDKVSKDTMKSVFKDKEELTLKLSKLEDKQQKLEMDRE